MVSTAPIGVFDSGLGGLSVVRHIRRDMPHERLIYYGDSLNAPYGLKTPDEVRALSFDIVDRFVKQGVKAVVIACNTATSVAAKELRDAYCIPIIGMEPALKVASDLGQGLPQRIIVAATPLTLRERKFSALMGQFASNNRIFPQPCPDLVTILEEGHLRDRGRVMSALADYLGSYDLNSIDSLVLGCTHFVFFRGYFRDFLPGSTTIIDGNHGTVHHLQVVLESLGQLAPLDAEGSLAVTNSDDSQRIRSLESQLLQL